MAVNKNFVVKNGLEVNDSLLVADQTSQKVGIGTSVSSYTLHVRGGIGATEARVTGVSTFVGDVHAESQLTVTGVTTLASAGGITTTGGDLYIGGELYVLDDFVYDEVTARNINITGISSFSTTHIAGIATINANGAQITGLSTFDGNVHLPDNKSVYFGGTPGTTTGDLQLFHDASHSYIRDQGTGDIRVRASGFDVRDSANALSILRADASGFMATTGIATVGVASITDVVVSGASTFTGIGTFASDLYVGGNAYVGGDLTFDEFTARNASITGIATAANFHIGAGGTVLNASNTGTFAIGSATTLATVTINGGSVPSIGLVIALGG